MSLRVFFLTGAGGGDFLALERARAAGLVDYEPVAVASAHAAGDALAQATRMGVPCAILDLKGRTPLERAEILERALAERVFDLCVLAGFPYLIPAASVARYRNSIVNSHHSILPGNPGLFRKERLVESDNKLLGATVHYVDEGMDTGRIICQAAFPNYGMGRFQEILDIYRRVQNVLMVTAFQLHAGTARLDTRAVCGQTLFWPAPEARVVDFFIPKGEAS